MYRGLDDVPRIPCRRLHKSTPGPVRSTNRPTPSGKDPAFEVRGPPFEVGSGPVGRSLGVPTLR